MICPQWLNQEFINRLSVVMSAFAHMYWCSVCVCAVSYTHLTLPTKLSV